MLAYKIQTLGDCPEESIQQFLHCMKPKIGTHHPGVSQADDDVSLFHSLSCWGLILDAVEQAAVKFI
jgi:hypothetical protein